MLTSKSRRNSGGDFLCNVLANCHMPLGLLELEPLSVCHAICRRVNAKRIQLPLRYKWEHHFASASARVQPVSVLYRSPASQEVNTFPTATYHVRLVIAPSEGKITARTGFLKLLLGAIRDSPLARVECICSRVAWLTTFVTFFEMTRF